MKILAQNKKQGPFTGVPNTITIFFKMSIMFLGYVLVTFGIHHPESKAQILSSVQ
jgi:hypothetical protein